MRLFTTLVRFDVVYYTLFKCNVRMIRYGYPALHGWLRRVYWDEGEGSAGGAFRNTTFFAEVCLFIFLNILGSSWSGLCLRFGVIVTDWFWILQIKRGYSSSIAAGNGIVPAGPVPFIMPLDE